MKKIKILIASLLVILTLCGSVLPASAYNEGIMPIYDHFTTCNLYFGVSNNEAYVSLDYDGTDTFTLVRMYVVVQKRTFGIFWNDVGTWDRDTSHAHSSLNAVIGVNGSGYYRAVITVWFYGTNGVTEKVERTLEYDYR